MAAKKKAAPRTIEPPADLARALRADEAAAESWARQSYTHRKEFVQWIEEAKKPETRERRLAKCLEMLGQGGKIAPTNSTRPLAERMRLKPEWSARLLDAPPEVATQLAAAGITLVSRGPASVVFLFVTTHADLAKRLPAARAALADAGQFWVAFPKQRSGVASDLRRDEGWDPVYAAGFTFGTLISVNERWSAMRFKPPAAR